MKQAIGKESKSVPLTPALRLGPVVIVSGQVPTDAQTGRVIDGGIQEQTSLVLEKIDALLREAGGSLADVVKTTVLMTDMSQFKAMNDVYKTYFGNPAPARSAFEVKLAIDALIEIEAFAYVPLE